MEVLIIDDEPQFRRALRHGLERQGYQVRAAATGAEGLQMAAEHLPDLVVLDLGLPDMDGLRVCRELREWYSAPIVVLSARDEVAAKSGALDLGADDYLTKPFSLDVLLARMRAVLRRCGEPETSQFEAEGLLIDFARRRATRDGEELRLTPTEFRLLAYLARHPDRVITIRQLLAKVWGETYAQDPHTLQVHVANLRRKLEPDPARPRFLHTEPRIGYRFRAGREEPAAQTTHTLPERPLESNR